VFEVETITTIITITITNDGVSVSK
jgi:hypothetical protein